MKKKDMRGSNPASFGVERGISSLLRPQMSDFPIPSSDEILVCPVGGVSEIGMNWTLYGHNGRWILVDAGLGFAKEYPSVAAIIPDFQVLKPLIPFLDGLVLTHAHEDHIGAVHRVWENIGCPIYATPFTSEIISLRLKSEGKKDCCDIYTFDPGDLINVGPFSIQTVPMNHSTIECVGLLIKTPFGQVFHTGDWKFDPDPVLGVATDKSVYKAIGDEGVLAMVSDSTNAARRGASMSEGALFEGFKRVMADHRGMVVVSCFASNIARMTTILKAARLTGRYVALAGRTMQVNEEVARKLGILNEEDAPIQARHIMHCDEYQRVVICTGAQGEPNAGLAKLINGEAAWLPKLREGDVVVHSARAIPGNEPQIEELLDKAREQGAKVLEQRYKDYPLHATGHGSGTELAEMYELIRPRFAVPVHGGPEQLSAHQDIAEAAGVPTFIPTTGSVFSIRPDGVDEVCRIEIGVICQYVTEPGAPAEFGPWNDEVRFALSGLADAESAYLALAS